MTAEFDRTSCHNSIARLVTTGSVVACEQPSLDPEHSRRKERPCRTQHPRRWISLGHVQILLSGPGASGSRPLPNGQRQGPGGWNRVVLKVSDLPGCISALTSNGQRFRNEMETGPAGRQIQIEDPDGNPIELFEPAR